MLLPVALLSCAPVATRVAAPVAVDDAYATELGNDLSVDAPGVLENDMDPDGDPLTAIPVGGTGAGVLRLFPDGSLEYEPASTGVHAFTYVASDGAQTSNVATILFTVTPAAAGATTYTDQGSFLADLNALGHAARVESFEDDAVWGATRSTSAPSVTNLGITWTSNEPANGVRTGPGPAAFGSYGFFSLPHGSYSSGMACSLPGECGDGWRGTSAETLVAIGGWVRTSPPLGKIHVVLDDDPARTYDAGQLLGTTFFGVIDPAGFDTFEFREVEGVLLDLFYVFGDHFTFARKRRRPLLGIASLTAGTIQVETPEPDGPPRLVPGSRARPEALELWLDCRDRTPASAFVFVFVGERPAIGLDTLAGPLLVGGRPLLVQHRPHRASIERLLLDLSDPTLLGASLSLQGLCLGAPSPVLSNAIEVLVGR